MHKALFYQHKTLQATVWWLMDCSFPELNWGRQRLFDDGSADLCFAPGDTLHAFAHAEDAVHFLSDDEYQTLETLLEERNDYPNMPSVIDEPPLWPDYAGQAFCYYAKY